MHVKSRDMYRHFDIIDAVEIKEKTFGPFKLNMWIKPLSEYQVAPPSSRETQIHSNEQTL